MRTDDPSELSERLSFDHLYNQVIVPFFASLDDGRAFNASYALLDALKAAFAIYSLKVPSLFQFRTLSQAEDHNLSTVYRGSVIFPATTVCAKSLTAWTLLPCGQVLRT